MTPSSAFVACEAQAAQWSPSRGNVFLIIPRPNLQYMRYRRTCPILWSAGALLPRVENTPARERFIPQASSSRSFPLLSDLRFRAPPPILPHSAPPCSPLRSPPLYSFLRLSTPLSPLASIPNITLARVYIMVGHGGRVGEVSPLSAKGGGASRFSPSRNVLCVSRSERAKPLLPRAHLRSR